MGRNALVGLKSTYRVKKIQEKKGRVEVTIEEDREVQYQGWIDVYYASLFLKGEAEGSGEWVIDAGRGVVLQHKARMELDHPEVTKAGEVEPVGGIRAKASLKFERKLEKLEGE